ncbi:SIS domain-containing protein [Planctomicrobium sp. SH668]|uniref:SIS domain-containing protein n=1 Tax=Planctomicrobium sp. SH668 TaxID=3448126 RepID=UPI003F5B1401
MIIRNEKGNVMYHERYIESLASSLRNTEVSVFDKAVSFEEGVESALSILRNLQKSNGKQHIVGNGASAAFSEHMALDWTKNGGVATTSPSSWVLISALANDLGFENAFSTYVDRYSHPGDLLVTISSSGNSLNVLNAIDAARTMGCQVITLSGLKEDNKSRTRGDVNFYVPAKTYGIVECAHQVLLHLLLDAFMGIEEWKRDVCQDMNIKSFQL